MTWHPQLAEQNSSLASHQGNSQATTWRVFVGFHLWIWCGSDWIVRLLKAYITHSSSLAMSALPQFRSHHSCRITRKFKADKYVSSKDFRKFRSSAVNGSQWLVAGDLQAVLERQCTVYIPGWACKLCFLPFPPRHDGSINPHRQWVWSKEIWQMQQHHAFCNSSISLSPGEPLGPPMARILSPRVYGAYLWLLSEWWSWNKQRLVPVTLKHAKAVWSKCVVFR